MISPLPDTPLQKAGQNVASDVQGAIEFSPIGDLVKRLIYARLQQQPDAFEQATKIPAAVRVAGAVIHPYITAGAGVMGAAMGALQGKSSDDIAAQGIEGARTGALLSPIANAISLVNAPRLYASPRYAGDERLVLQSLTKYLTK